MSLSNDNILTTKRIRRKPSTSFTPLLASATRFNSLNTEVQDLVSVLGITAIIGYNDETNQCIGLCSESRRDYNLLLSQATVRNNMRYRMHHKHRLMYAALYGPVEWFKTLLYNAGDDSIALRNSNGGTLYHVLADMNKYRYRDKKIYSKEIERRTVILGLLFNTKLDMYIKNNDGNSAMFIAFENQVDEIFYELFRHLDITHIHDTNNKGQDLLSVAINLGSVDVVKRLVAMDVKSTLDYNRALFQNKVPHFSYPWVVSYLIDNCINRLDFQTQYKEGYNLFTTVCALRNSFSLCQRVLQLVPNITILPSAILEAAKHNAQIANLILDHTGSAYINTRYTSGSTLFSICCQKGWLDVVKRLMKMNVNITPFDRNNIVLAASNYERSTVEYLLDYAARFDMNATTSNGRTVFSYACSHGWLSTVQRLLTLPNVNITSNDFIMAVNYRQEEIVTYLVDHAIDRFNIRDGQIFVNCCQYGWVNVIRRLVAIPSCALETASTTGIYAAAEHKHHDVVELLLDYMDRYDINKVDYNDNVFTYACQHSWLDIVTRLVALPHVKLHTLSDQSAYARMSHCTGILEAARAGNHAIVNLLLDYTDRYDINNETAQENGTVFYWACVHGWKDMVERLITIPNIKFDTARSSVVLEAATHNHVDIVRMLLPYIDKVDINIPNHQGNTLLHIAVKNNWIDVVRVLGNNPKVIRTIGNNKRQTPLDIAEHEGNKAMIRLLSK